MLLGFVKAPATAPAIAPWHRMLMVLGNLFHNPFVYASGSGVMVLRRACNMFPPWYNILHLLLKLAPPDILIGACKPDDDGPHLT